MSTRKNSIKMVMRLVCGVLLTLIITACQTPAIEVATSTPMTDAPTPSATDTLVPPSPTTALEPYTDLIRYRGEGKFNIQQILSVRLPENATPPYPTVVLFHPGIKGEKEEMDEYAVNLSTRGFAAVNVNYIQQPYPAPVNDAFCALAWVHAEAATYGFDTTHVIALGADTGGALSSLLGLITDPAPYLEDCVNSTLPENPLAGVVSYSGIYDYASEDDFGFLIKEFYEPYLRVGQEGFEQRRDQASPTTHIHAGAPPFLLVHGLDDSWISVDHTERFVDALQAEGVAVEFMQIPGVEHYVMDAQAAPRPITIEDMHLDDVEAFILGLQ